MEKSTENYINTWELLQGGDLKALEILYFGHFQRLYEYGCRLHNDTFLVKDSIHDLFLKLWTDRDRLSRVTNVKAYLLVALRSIIYNKSDRHKRISLGMPKAGTTDFMMTFSPESDYIKKEELSAKNTGLLAAINGLSARQKEIIYLRYFEELEYHQIAEIMGISVKAAYKLSARALEALRELLGNPLLLFLFLLVTMQKNK